jgi:hypothetical protein
MRAIRLFAVVALAGIPAFGSACSDESDDAGSPAVDGGPGKPTSLGGSSSGGSGAVGGTEQGPVVEGDLTCRYFPLVEPPCDAQVDVVGACHLSAMQAIIQPTIADFPAGPLAFGLLPLQGFGGEPGGGGSSGNLRYLPLNPRPSGPPGSVELLDDGNYLVLTPDAEFIVSIPDVATQGYLEPISPGSLHDARRGTLVVMAQDRGLDERRLLVFAEQNCFDENISHYLSQLRERPPGAGERAFATPLG